MTVPAYAIYRDSGVSWLGSVPEHWRSAPFWSLFRRTKRIGYPEAELLSVYRDYGVIRKSDRDDNHNNPSEDLGAYQLVEPGDLAVNKMKAWQGSLGVSAYRGIVSPAYFVYKSNHSEDSRYLHYLLRSAPFAAAFMKISKGIRINQWDVDPDQLRQLPMFLPSRSEQSDIAAFLDLETGKIDELVETQRRLIELLKEKRQAVISHAVTKGIDPAVSMKDYGVEWLGEMPAHWEVSRVKYAASNVVDCLHTTPTYEGDLEFPAVRTADIERGRLLLDQARLVSREIYEDRIQRLVPDEGDILYTREGERFGLAALVPSGVKLCLGQRMMMLRIDAMHDPAFVMWVLNSDACYQQVVAGITGSTAPHVNISEVVNFHLPVPPISEQRAIARHIERIVGNIDRLADKANAASELLRERRSALISAAVTGKVDVRAAGVVEVQSAEMPVDAVTVRKLVGSAVLELLAGRPDSGRVKAQKLIYLAEAHAGVRELGGQYTRMAAGPYDGGLIEETEFQLCRAGQVQVEQPTGPGGPVLYTIIGQRGRFRDELDRLLGDRKRMFDKTLTDVATLDTRGAEAVATLYAVWNDILLDGDDPTDDLIISGLLDGWHPEKRAKFKDANLRIWLGWMRRHDLVPRGQGPRTTTGRLLV